MLLSRQSISLWNAFLLAMFGQVCAADMASLDQISEVHQRQREMLSSVRLDFTKTISPLIPAEPFWEHCRIMDYYAGPTTATVVITRQGKIYYRALAQRRSGDKILRQIESSRPDQVTIGERDATAAEIVKALPHVQPEPEETFFMFDGTRLMKKSPFPSVRRGIERKVYAVIYIGRLKGKYFPATPLDFCLCTFPSPGLPNDDRYRQRHRIPDLFALGEFSVRPEPETIDGVSCVVLEAPHLDTLWLAPEMNFAVKKRHLFYVGRMITNGSVLMEIECRDFQQASDGLWLPTLLVVHHLGGKGLVPPEYEGVPLYDETYDITKIEVNSPDHESFFKSPIEPGDLVVDQTLVDPEELERARKLPGGSVIPTVSYVMPADEKDLDEVIRRAKEGRKRGPPATNWVAISLVLANVAIVLTLAAIMLWRRWAPRKPAT